MRIDPSKQTRQENNKLLIGSIVPRPIAFVTSVDEDGVCNAAPFSFFNIVGIEPPLVMISCIRKGNGVQKDTARNVLWTREFIVHVVDEQNVGQVNETSIDAPPAIDELELAGFTTLPGEMVQVPRVIEAKIAMECKLYQSLELGKSKSGDPTVDLLIGEIVYFHIDDELYDQGRIRLELLKPVSRLAGLFYGTIGHTFELPRPLWDTKSK